MKPCKARYEHIDQDEFGEGRKITSNMLKISEITKLIDIGNRKNTPTLPSLKTAPIEDIKIIPEVELPQTPSISDVTDFADIKELSPSQDIPEIPLEPLYGAVIPLKGDKTQGYLLLGFIKL